MENLYFYREDRLFKENKLKRVINSKVSDVANHNIQRIIQAIDINKQYYVRVTRNPRKFLNTVTEESVKRTDISFTSKSSIIYGDCVPGSFIDVYGERKHSEGYLEARGAAAAVKVLYNGDLQHPDKTEYFLVIYEPMSSVC